MSVLTKAQVVVDFPSTEDHARRRRLEVERLALQSPTEWMYYVELPGYAEKYGVDKATLKRMIEATIKANEKKAREDRGEQRRAKKQTERKQEREERDNARDKQKTFDTTIKLPTTQHGRKIRELAIRIGGDADKLRAEFDAFVDESTSGIVADLAPWPNPVNTKTLLADVMAQLRRYMVVTDEQAVAITLWVAFAWLHDFAVYSPILVFKSAEPDSGKTNACGVLRFLTPRAYSAAEMSGPSLFRFVDRVRPTLIIDDADRLLQRKPDLAHIINVGWTLGTLIPRVGPDGEIVWFNPFCPKILAGVKLLLPKATMTRTIIIEVLTKLPSEKVEEFSFVDDARFHELRRKLLRWSTDNAAALKAASPELPPGFNNRLAMNWRLQLAVADLAGGDWPKRARAAAVKLDNKREELSEGIRLLAALHPMFTVEEELTSETIEKRLTADPLGDWANFRERAPITQRQIAVLLKPYGIHPVVLHPTKRADFSPRGYRRSQFADAFARHLPGHPHIRTSTKRKK
jgi:putative DNA primase/helicase